MFQHLSACSYQYGNNLWAAGTADGYMRPPSCAGTGTNDGDGDGDTFSSQGTDGDEDQ